jgi:hypothetical protein
MTRKDFVELAKKGWETYDYCADTFYDTYRWKTKESTKACCAIGAAAAAVNLSVKELLDHIDVEFDYIDVMQISDDAGSKETAIQALEAWAA